MKPRKLQLPLAMLLGFCAVGSAWSSPANSRVPKVPDGPAGQVQFQVLHSFGAAGDGDSPSGALVMDSKGNLYGVTGFGGGSGYGTVYELSPTGNGQWTETVLYSFIGPPDGYEPLGLAIDGTGNLYVSTGFGGGGEYCELNICGLILELSPGSNGGWAENII